MANLTLHSLSSSNRLKRELMQGEEYRSFKNIEDTVVQPVRSPVDISFFVHRKRYVSKVEENIKLTKSTLASKRTLNSSSREKKSKSVPYIKHSFWERAKLSHKQYTDILSTPHLHGSGDSEAMRNLHSETGTTICSPRLAQMAHPNKRRILGVWQEHGHKLPVDALQRLHDMLYTDQSIDMKEARNFFKICDKKKRKLEQKIKLKKNKKKNQKEAMWLRKQLEETSSAILNHFSKEPNLDTSFKQLLLSDVLLSVLGKLTKKRQPILRYSSNLYDRELVKLVDKIAIWTDNVSKIVDIRSLEEEEEEEGEAEQNEISKISEESFSIASSMLRIANEPDQGGDSGIKKEPEKTVKTESKGDGEEENLGKVSSLQKLIQILAQASSEYLANVVDYENMTRNELLHRMKILNKTYVDGSPAEVMNAIILDWAMHNAPDKVDMEIINKIEKMSEILVAMIEAEEVYAMMAALPEAATDQIGSAAAEKDGVPGSIPGTIKSTEKTDESSKKGAEFTGEGKPEPGTLTEIKAPDGTVQMGVIDENGEVTPVQLTPSGNLIPTVYDKNAKVVNKVFDDEGNLVDSTFNKYGVPEPDNYDGNLYDDEKKPHELIFNSKGKKIPQTYDKDGNPIAADYDNDGNPLYFEEDGQRVQGGQGEVLKTEDKSEKEKDDQPVGDEKKEDSEKKDEGTKEPQPEESGSEAQNGPKEETNKLNEDKEGLEKKEEIAENIQQENIDSKTEDKPVEEDKNAKDLPTLPEENKTEIKDETEAKKLEAAESEDKKTEEKANENKEDEEKKKATENVEADLKGNEIPDEKKVDEKLVEEKKQLESKGESEGAVKESVDDGKKDETEDKDEGKVKFVEEKAMDDNVTEEKRDDKVEEDQKEKKEGEGMGVTITEEDEKGEEEVPGSEVIGAEGQLEEAATIQKEGEPKEEKKQEREELLEEEESEADQESKSEGEEEELQKEKEKGISPAVSREKMVSVIKGHIPKRIQEHSEDTVCCLSLKIWAVWLLEITHNAHNWTKWISNIISQIREFAAIMRGEILLSNGQKRVIFREDWNKFIEDMNEEVIAWRQYSRHVNDLTKKIIQKFHGKKVYCCQKCLQDHLIKNVVTAHDTMRALTEALNCTGYWQRCLDEIVQATSKLFTALPHVDEYSSDEETGWSYSVSSDDDEGNSDIKKMETMPTSTWKRPPASPCSCRVKQLFPRPQQTEAGYKMSYSFGQINEHVPHRCYM